MGERKKFQIDFQTFFIKPTRKNHHKLSPNRVVTASLLFQSHTFLCIEIWFSWETELLLLFHFFTCLEKYSNVFDLMIRKFETVKLKIAFFLEGNRLKLNNARSTTKTKLNFNELNGKVFLWVERSVSVMNCHESVLYFYVVDIKVNCRFFFRFSFLRVSFFICRFFFFSMAADKKNIHIFDSRTLWYVFFHFILVESSEREEKKLCLFNKNILPTPEKCLLITFRKHKNGKRFYMGRLRGKNVKNNKKILW